MFRRYLHNLKMRPNNFIFELKKRFKNLNKCDSNLFSSNSNYDSMKYKL
jgi:hypothetical protein